jgi:uracil-DNA glycosylase family 4
MDEDSISALNMKIINCRKCSRLVDFREHVLEKSKKYEREIFWRKPLTGYGDINGRMMIVGLAPAASGGNRTGRVFTGDKSSEFLISCLYDAGITNQKTSLSKDDGLTYFDSYISLAVRCVPPENKPEKGEITNCNMYLLQEIQLMKNLKIIVVLGKIAFDAVVQSLREMGKTVRGWKFGNGEIYEIDRYRVMCIFHPSPRNVNTGRISAEKFVELFRKAKEMSE